MPHSQGESSAGPAMSEQEFRLATGVFDPQKYEEYQRQVTRAAGVCSRCSWRPFYSSMWVRPQEGGRKGGGDSAAPHEAGTRDCRCNKRCSTCVVRRARLTLCVTV